MRLAPEQARARMVAHDHGILCTVHVERGVDAVPVAFAVVGGGFVGETAHGAGDLVGIPVDRVKPKASQRLQRERNLEADPRATLLVEHWDADDWSRLWWVRAELRHVPDPAPELTDALAARLAASYPQYRDRPFSSVLVLRVVGLAGWTAADDEP